MHDGMPYGRNQGQGQGHSREVDRQSPTGLIFFIVFKPIHSSMHDFINSSNMSLCIVGGFSLPTERWKEIMTDVNSKIEALEIEYETICIENKVGIC